MFLSVAETFERFKRESLKEFKRVSLILVDAGTVPRLDVDSQVPLVKFFACWNVQRFFFFFFFLKLVPGEGRLCGTLSVTREKNAT